MSLKSHNDRYKYDLSSRTRSVKEIIGPAAFRQSVTFAHAIATKRLEDIISPNGHLSAERFTICHFLLHQNRNLTKAKLRERTKHIFTKLKPYLIASFPHLGGLTHKKVELLLWVQDTYPVIAEDVDLTIDWVNKINSDKLRRVVSKYFPPPYPFCRIEFRSFQDGSAKLLVHAKTKFSVGYLKFLNKLPNTRLIQTGVELTLNVNLGMSRRDFLSRAGDFLDKLDSFLSSSGCETKELFYSAKSELENAFAQHLQRVHDGFRDLSYYQTHPPVREPVKWISNDCISMVEAMQLRDVNTVRRLLANGAPSEHCSYGMTKLMTGRDYEFLPILGRPSSSELSMLQDGDYVALVSKESGRYFIYTSMPQQPYTSKAITRVSDVNFLNTLSEEYFLYNGDLDDKAEEDNITKKMMEMVCRMLPDTLEVEYQSETKDALAILSLLVEYNVNFGTLGEPGTQTVFEYLIGHASLQPSTNFEKERVKTFIRFMLPFDKGQSCLRVAPEYRDHYIGRTILETRTALCAAQNHPKHMRDTNLGLFYGRPSLRFVNHQNKEVYLQTYTLKELMHKPKEMQQVLDLSEKVFLNSTNMTKAELREYIINKLSPDSDSYIDLLFDQDKNIVAFNITKVMPSTKPGQPTILYIPLAAAERSIQQDFRRLMSIISFRRVFSLSAKYGEAVLTAYNASSAASYLQSATLRVYPKYNCLQAQDWQRLAESVFKGRKIIEADSVKYFPSKLHAHKPAKTSNSLPTLSSINCNAFNERYAREGCSTLVAFYSSPANTSGLFQKLQQQLPGTPSFADVVRGTRILDDFSDNKIKAKL